MRFLQAVNARFALTACLFHFLLVAGVLGTLRQLHATQRALEAVSPVGQAACPTGLRIERQAAIARATQSCRQWHPTPLTLLKK